MIFHSCEYLEVSLDFMKSDEIKLPIIVQKIKAAPENIILKLERSKGIMEEVRINEEMLRKQDEKSEEVYLEEIFNEFKEFMKSKKGSGEVFENYTTTAIDRLALNRLMHSGAKKQKLKRFSSVHDLIYDNPIQKQSKSNKKNYYNRWYIPVKNWHFEKKGLAEYDQKQLKQGN